MRRRSDLSDIIDQSRLRFQFSISIEEDRFFRKLVSNRLKVHIDWEASALQGLIIAAAAMILGLLAVALEWSSPQTLFVLMVCFALGQVYAAFVTGWIIRRIHDKLFELDRVGQMTWQVDLDDSSIVIRTPGIERRASWHSIQGVTDASVMVAIWYNSGHGFFIPARAFIDPSARAAFAEWASERLRAATASSSATKSA